MFIPRGLDPMGTADWATGDTWPKLCQSNPPTRWWKWNAWRKGRLDEWQPYLAYVPVKVERALPQRGRKRDSCDGSLWTRVPGKWKKCTPVPRCSLFLSLALPKPSCASSNWVLCVLPLYPRNKLFLFSGLKWVPATFNQTIPKKLSLS